jgi:hypothetical protein
MADTSQAPRKRGWVRLLTTESFLGCFSLTIIACSALFVTAYTQTNQDALFTVIGGCVAGIAAMLRNKEGQD